MSAQDRLSQEDPEAENRCFDEQMKELEAFLVSCTRNGGPVVENDTGSDAVNSENALFHFLSLMVAMEVYGAVKDAAFLRELILAGKVRISLTPSIEGETSDQLPMAFGGHFGDFGAKFVLLVNVNKFGSAEVTTEAVHSPRFGRFVSNIRQSVKPVFDNWPSRIVDAASFDVRSVLSDPATKAGYICY